MVLAGRYEEGSTGFLEQAYHVKRIERLGFP